MSDEHVSVVRESFEAFLSGDIEAGWSKWSDDAITISAPEWPERGIAEGLDEVIAGFQGWVDAFGPDWTQRLSISDYVDTGGGSVLVEMSFSSEGAGSGAPVSQQLSGIYTVRDGKIAKGEFFMSHEAGRRAAGLG